MRSLQTPDEMSCTLGSLWKLAGIGELPNDEILLKEPPAERVLQYDRYDK